jgi:tripartite-type tricarboxylate transporter receptor subunit TctC
MKTIGLALAALALAAACTGEADAQQYPTRPVKILVTIPPGGAPDIAARLLAQRLTETMGGSFFVENRPGANGNVAADAVAKGEPDGYTLILGADSLITINPHVYASLPYDALKDLLPVSSVASNQFFLAVNPGLPVKTVPELVEHARKANSPAGTATVAGETMVVLAGASSAGLLKGGQLRGIATTGTKRSPLFPDLPPIADYYPGYDLTIWLGLFAPPSTPEPIVTRLRTEVQKVLKEAEFAQKLNVTGALEPLVLTPADFNALIRRDYDKYGKLVRDVGVKIQ